MKKIFFILLATIFLFGIVTAGGLTKICIDLDPPTWPENSTLTLTVSGNDIQLSWIGAIDIPSCSGIDYYTIWGSTNGINFSSIVNTSDTTYTDTSLSYGNTYYYMIHVFDLAGHNEGEEALSNYYTLSPPSGPTPSRGGPSSYWECVEWGECINGTQTRTCSDIGGVQEDRIETRECFPEFIPTGQESEENETVTVTTTPPGFFATITGAVIGTLGTGGTVFAIVFVLLIVALAIVFSVKGRKRE